MEHEISIRVNGRLYRRRVESGETLLKFLRDRLELTGAKEGCGVGECGACTVIMNGSAVRSCLVLAVEADGAEVVTVEGLAHKDRLSPVQEAFVEAGAVQCGFCIPGFVVAGENLLKNNPSPTKDEVIEAFSGHLCRCTGYSQILEAMELAAEKYKKTEKVH